MSEPVRWVLFVATALGPSFAAYGIFELAGWRGTAASWALAGVAVALTFLVLRAVYGPRH
jgi:hypothetical protein